MGGQGRQASLSVQAGEAAWALTFWALTEVCDSPHRVRGWDPCAPLTNPLWPVPSRSPTWLLLGPTGSQILESGEGGLLITRLLGGHLAMGWWRRRFS